MNSFFYTSVTDSQLAVVKQQILYWVNTHAYAAFYDSNGQQPACSMGKYELLAAAGAKKIIRPPQGSSFERLKSVNQGSWLFGYLGYDLKNEVEQLQSANTDFMQADDSCFFEPEYVVEVFWNGQIVVHGENPELIWEQIMACSPDYSEPFVLEEELEAVMSKAEYLEKVRTIIRHIEEGDVYELNLCQEFRGKVASGNPLATWIRLNQLSPMPFSAYVKLGELYILCASPERFLYKRDNMLVSQPIKGTQRRDNDLGIDEQKKLALLHSEKERAENLMIVDLVRNDLSRTCVPGSVKVNELFGIYTFKQVHQMISTVNGDLEAGKNWIDAIKAAFPMGSMTGAPKVMAMSLIERYELSKRGVYSGALGYVDPEQNMDFNVLIRSILYNSSNQKISFQVGGAITYDSVPEEEYEECLLKARAMLQVLQERKST